LLYPTIDEVRYDESLLTFLIGVLTVRTCGADSSHIWCWWSAPLVLST